MGFPATGAGKPGLMKSPLVNLSRAAACRALAGPAAVVAFQFGVEYLFIQARKKALAIAMAARALAVAPLAEASDLNAVAVITSGHLSSILPWH